MVRVVVVTASGTMVGATSSFCLMPRVAPPFIPTRRRGYYIMTFMRRHPYLTNPIKEEKEGRKEGWRSFHHWLNLHLVLLAEGGLSI